jgi:aspartate semialdehyde dehydrogenase (EC 1.2.1.11)
MDEHDYRVGILGATGAVGQTFIRLLDDHPWFTVTSVAASERSAGRPYRDAANWLSGQPIPPSVASLEVQSTEPEAMDCDVVFSALDSSVAGEIEEAFARAGVPVVSNAKNYRQHDRVPLLIPEVNPGHLALIDEQSWAKASSSPTRTAPRRGSSAGSTPDGRVRPGGGAGDDAAGVVRGRLSGRAVARRGGQRHSPHWRGGGEAGDGAPQDPGYARRRPHRAGGPDPECAVHARAGPKRAPGLCLRAVPR